MKGYHFYATMPDERKSKGASKAHRMPFTRKTLESYAQPTLPPGTGPRKYVECLAVMPDTAQPSVHHAALQYDCVGALMADNDQAVCGSTCHNTYLRERCVRISEALARKLHPALFRHLEPAK